MSIVCDIVKDMMPIYLDGAASKPSNKLMKRHTKKCKHCAEYMKMCKNSKELEIMRKQKNKGKKDDIVYLPDDGYEIIAERVNKSIMFERVASVSAAVAAGVTALIIMLVKKDSKK